MGGVFLVLTVGVTVSFFYTMFELLWETVFTSRRENVSTIRDLCFNLFIQSTSFKYILGNILEAVDSIIKCSGMSCILKHVNVS